jgi:hypothetical protein
MRTFAIGDVHGEYEKLHHALGFIESVAAGIPPE